MKNRGVLYLLWGDKAQTALERSIDSLKKFHPDLPVKVEVLKEIQDPMEGLLQKSKMAEFSPFEETLYLDADTVVLGNLDFAFEKASRFGLACTICECPWARRYPQIKGDIVEYNTGVLFFTEKARPVFDEWQQAVLTIDSSTLFYRNGELLKSPYDDQAGFAYAVETTGFQPFVLPLNWNLRPMWQQSLFGPVKIWHDYSEVPPFLYEAANYYEQPDAVIQYTEFKRCAPDFAVAQTTA